ncbi:hypothetical protein X274_09160 [Marinitoga sp. 1155]|nr:hypothetical protein X274_09160 [Marinitoga sp. 1155]
MSIKSSKTEKNLWFFPKILELTVFNYQNFIF